MVIALSSSYKDVGQIGRPRVGCSFWFCGCVLCSGCVHLGQGVICLPHANCVAKVMFCRVCFSVSLLPMMQLVSHHTRTPPPPSSPYNDLPGPGCPRHFQTCSTWTSLHRASPPSPDFMNFDPSVSPGPYCWQVGSWHLTEMSCMCLDWYVSTFTALTVSLVCVFVTLESLLKLQI